jgi:virulence-associated protein VagC
LLDGDIICLTNQKEIIEGAYGGLPIMYETKNATKSKIIESELYKSDMKGFNTKVGFLTNLSTTMYSMLPLFEENSDEYKEIIRRLKQCRKEQGVIIDGTKGLVIKPIPSHWTKWTKITEDMSEEEIEKARFNNSILIDKRPQFMTNLYSNYSKGYHKHCCTYDILAQANFRMFLNELLELDKEDLNKKQEEFLEKFYRYNPLLDSNCVMNNISKYMQKKTKEIKLKPSSCNIENIVKMLKSKNFEIDKVKLDKLYNIYKKYKSGRRNFNSIKDDEDNIRFKTIEQYNKAIRQEALIISSDIRELASLAVVLVYELYPSDNKSFAWAIFGDGIIENIKENKQKNIVMPFLDNGGDIEYLGKRYSRKELIIDDNEFDFDCAKYL